MLTFEIVSEEAGQLPGELPAGFEFIHQRSNERIPTFGARLQQYLLSLQIADDRYDILFKRVILSGIRPVLQGWLPHSPPLNTELDAFMAYFQRMEDFYYYRYVHQDLFALTLAIHRASVNNLDYSARIRSLVQAHDVREQELALQEIPVVHLANPFNIHIVTAYGDH